MEPSELPCAYRTCTAGPGPKSQQASLRTEPHFLNWLGPRIADFVGIDKGRCIDTRFQC